MCGSTYTPHGDYTKGKLPTWGELRTFRARGVVQLLSSKIGLEISAYAGLDFNTENDATDYQSGDLSYLGLDRAPMAPAPWSSTALLESAQRPFTGSSYTATAARAVLGSFEAAPRELDRLSPMCLHRFAVTQSWPSEMAPEIDVNNASAGITSGSRR